MQMMADMGYNTVGWNDHQGKTGRLLNEIYSERRLASVAVRTGDGWPCCERA
jgi:hypothetical protein